MNDIFQSAARSRRSNAAIAAVLIVVAIAAFDRRDLAAD
jgi:hypothetical protein